VALMTAKLVAFLPAGLRVAGVVFFAPGLGGEKTPPTVRVALALGLAAVVVPVCVRTPPPVGDPGLFVALCLAELAFGIALGFAMGALLEALRFGGEILDLQIGLRAGQLFDPSTGSQSGILSTGYYMIALVLFMQLDGHHYLLRGLAASFQMTPVGELTLRPCLMRVVSDLGSSLLAIGVRVAAPVIAALLLADLSFGLVARAVPQVNVFLVGIPAKMALGFIIAAISASLLSENIAQIIQSGARFMDHIIRAAS
jgi:flagellar biosynthetic protein FliR